MKKALVLFAFLLVCSMLAGCGGIGSLVPGNLFGGSNRSPFAGNWSGTWTDSIDNSNGTIAVTIGTDGSVTGTIHNNNTGASGSFTGTISNAGSANWREAYPSATYNGTGTLAIDNTGHLLGDIQNKNGSTLIGTMSVDLTKQ